MIYTFEPGFLARIGGHYYKDVCGTLRAKAGDNQMSIAYSIDTYNQAAEKEIMGAIRTNGGGDCIPKVVYSIENHPNDSRVKLSEDNKVQALTTRMGTGGGNVPLIAIGVDLYNQTETGSISRTLNAVRSDADHVPCILIGEENV